jgi:hypothetical protein
LPADHRVADGDIKMVELTMDKLDELSDLDLTMMLPNDIVGRVLRKAKRSGEPFLTTDLYLEGTEPGAPPEPPYAVDPPWLPIDELHLLEHELAKELDPHEFLLLPTASVDLPVGRVVRRSDVRFHPFRVEVLREAWLPGIKVLVEPNEFIGRRLTVAKRGGDNFLLSDFSVSKEIETELRKHWPNFNSPKFEPPAKWMTMEEIEETFGAIELEPALPQDEPSSESVSDDPESLFGALPADAQQQPGSSLARVMADEYFMIDLAWRSAPIGFVTPGVHDLRDEVGTSLAAPVPLGVGGLTAGDESPAWFGGATLVDDVTNGVDQSGGAIDALSREPTTGDFAISLPRERRAQAEDEPPPEEPWWRKLEDNDGDSTTTIHDDAPGVFGPNIFDGVLP